jgi:hypothetical protein
VFVKIFTSYFNEKRLNHTIPLAILIVAGIPFSLHISTPKINFSIKGKDIMENNSKKDDVPKKNEPNSPSDKPEKSSPNSASRKSEKYCPFSLAIPMRSVSYNIFQSKCSTMIWHWDNIPTYTKPLKKG